MLFQIVHTNKGWSERVLWVLKTSKVPIMPGWEGFLLNCGFWGSSRCGSEFPIMIKLGWKGFFVGSEENTPNLLTFATVDADIRPCCVGSIATPSLPSWSPPFSSFSAGCSPVDHRFCMEKVLNISYQLWRFSSLFSPDSDRSDSPPVSFFSALYIVARVAFRSGKLPPRIPLLFSWPFIMTSPLGRLLIVSANDDDTEAEGRVWLLCLRPSGTSFNIAFPLAAYADPIVWE